MWYMDVHGEFLLPLQYHWLKVGGNERSPLLLSGHLSGHGTAAGSSFSKCHQVSEKWRFRTLEFPTAFSKNNRFIPILDNFGIPDDNPFKLIDCSQAHGAQERLDMFFSFSNENMPNRHTSFLANDSNLFAAIQGAKILHTDTPRYLQGTVPVAYQIMSNTSVNGLVKAKHLQETHGFLVLHGFYIVFFSIHKIGISFVILWIFPSKSPLAQQFGSPLPAAGCLVHAATESELDVSPISQSFHQSLYKL